MLDLMELEKAFLMKHIRVGGAVADFTMGNGHDTAFLSKAVGAEGRVYAFDIQAKALASTTETLRAEGCPDNVTLICDSHSNAVDYIEGKLCAGVFNLGYLPGGQNKQVTTLRPTTMKAVADAIAMLDRDGGLLIAVYPGHEEGRLEGEMLTEYFATLDRRRICVGCFRIVNSPTSPFFFTVETK